MANVKRQTVNVLSLPYNPPFWPTLPPLTEAAILTLLIPLLQPVGDFRRDHVPRSKGKGRARKSEKPADPDPSSNSMPPWIPEIYDHLTIGFNTTVRRLEALSHARKPAILHNHSTPRRPESPPPAALTAIFVCRRSLPEIVTSSIPLLVATAASTDARARLIEISPQSEAKIAQALGQPRVGVLAIEVDAPGIAPLTKFAHDNIDPVNVPWLEQAANPSYLPVKIQATEVVLKSKSTTSLLKRKRAVNS